MALQSGTSGIFPTCYPSAQDPAVKSKVLHRMIRTNPELKEACQPELQVQDCIVFFDGICGFCNHTVNFLMARDQARNLRFAPLQGETAARYLPEPFRQQLDTLVFWFRGRNYVRSAAIVRILWNLKGVWPVIAILLWLIPLPIRDLGYCGMSRVRYRLFGKMDACRLPRPEERGLILD